MKKNILIGLLCSTFLLVACNKTPVSTTPTSETTGDGTTQTSMEKRPGTTTIALTEQNGSGQTGTATFEDMGGSTKVTISLAGGSFTSPQPAHIHMGACPTPGAVKYPLTDLVDGASETTIDAPYSSLWSGDLAINVHKSASEVKEYTACGDLSAPASDTTGDAAVDVPAQY